MKVALLCDRKLEAALRSSLAHSVQSRTDIPVEIIDGHGGRLFLACVEDFLSFEEGWSRIELVKLELGLLVGGHYDIWVKENDLDEFISHGNYTVELERRMAATEEIQIEATRRRNKAALVVDL